MIELSAKNVHSHNTTMENHALIVIKFTESTVTFVIKILALSVKARSLSLMGCVNAMNRDLLIKRSLNAFHVLNLKYLIIVFNALMMRISVSFARSILKKTRFII